MTPRDEAEEVRRGITEHFLERQCGCTVKELAERLGRSERWIRRVITAHDGAVAGTRYETEIRESFRHSYRYLQSGAHRVSVYLPTLHHLRDLLLAVRGDE